MKYLKNNTNLLLWAVIALSIAAMHNVIFLSWVDWDDKVNVIDNVLIRTLSWDSIVEMFKTLELNGSYMPLPMLTWAINYKMAGMEPMVYHVSNLLLHIGTTALVYALIKQVTRNLWLAGITALLFGIHPVHVEPVAWITGRKDMLYAFFMMASLVCYVVSLRSNKYRLALYIAAFLLFIPSLFSKGVAVVLPLLMLLIDFYEKRIDWFRLAIEKVPFFGLSLVFGLIAVYTQSQTAALDNVQDVPFHISAVTSSYSLTLYLIQLVAPFRMGGFHPYPPPTAVFPWYMILSVFTPVILFVAAVFFRKNKNVLFGLGFMMTCFLPVIQFLPVGDAIVADRYAYMPYMGGFFLMALMMKKVYSLITLNGGKKALIVGFAIYFGWLGLTAHQSTYIWQNSKNLWTNVIQQYPYDSKGYINRGRYYLDRGELGLAEADFNRGLGISPEMPVVHQHLGLLYQRKQNHSKALLAFGQAIKLDSLYSPAWLNLAISHMRLQQVDSALTYLTELESLDSSNVLVHINRGVVFEQQSKFELALAEYGMAISKDKNDYKGFQYRTVVLYRIGRYAEALVDVEKWINRSPRDGKAHVWRSRLQFLAGNFNKAKSDIDIAINLGTSVKEEYLNLLIDSLQVNRP